MMISWPTGTIKRSQHQCPVCHWKQKQQYTLAQLSQLCESSISISAIERTWCHDLGNQAHNGRNHWAYTGNQWDLCEHAHPCLFSTNLLVSIAICPIIIKYDIEEGQGSHVINQLLLVSLAQLVERRSHNPEVVSSILTGGTVLLIFSIMSLLWQLSRSRQVT